MIHNILRLSKNYHKLVLAYGGHIDKLEFNKMRNIDERRDYLLSKGYHLIGSGSSRDVFLENSKKVIKLAVDIGGVAQTQAEYTILASNKNPLLPKLYDCAPDYSWIEIEYCKTFDSSELMQHLNLDIDGDDFYNAMSNIKGGETIEEAIQEINKKTRSLRAKKSTMLTGNIEFLEHIVYVLGEINKNPIIHSLIEFCNENNLHIIDFATADNWGTNMDGELKIIDTGFTIDVQRRLYDTGLSAIPIKKYKTNPGLGMYDTKKVVTKDPHNIIQGQ
jgi:hypothetical protein